MAFWDLSISAVGLLLRELVLRTAANMSLSGLSFAYCTELAPRILHHLNARTVHVARGTCPFMKVVLQFCQSLGHKSKFSRRNID